jgi:ketosteroid isomerase-like protein
LLDCIMRANFNVEKEVVSTINQLFEAYKKRDLQAMLAVLAPDADVLVIGSGEDERSIGPSDFGKSAQRDWKQSESASIKAENVLVSCAGIVAWFAADVNFQFSIKGKKYDLEGRLTGIMENRMGKWLLMQLHFSTPSCQQNHGHSWPQP